MMPQDLTKLTVKLNNERIVPTRRFNLAAGAPSKVLRTVSAAQQKLVAPGTTMVAHPVLRSVPLATAQEAQEALPVVREGEAGPLYPDRKDENVRWYLPAYELLKPGDLEGPLLQVRDIGVDEEGEPVFAGTLTFSFVKTTPTPEAVNQALDEARRKLPDLEAREIPLTPKEVELQLTFQQDGQERTNTLTTTYDAERNQAQFELRGSALQLAYALLAQREGVRVVLIGDFNSWVPTERESERLAAAQEAVKSKVVTAKAALMGRVRALTPKQLVSARLRDHRRGKSRVIRRDHRRRKVRDHRGGRDHRKRPKVRDHRDSSNPGRRPKVRDHRKPRDRGKRPKVRDHRDRPKGGKEPDSSEEMARQRQIVRQERTAHVPCGQFRQLYRFENEQGVSRVFGCEPPWGGDFRPGAHYCQLGRDELDLPDELRDRLSVYESLDEVAVFLLVPKSYVLARTTDSFAPALSMTTVLDAEEVLQSKVVFDFVVAPDLLPFDLWQIRAALADYLQAQMGLERRPDLRFPTSLATPPEIGWRGPFTQMTLLIADGDSYVMTVEANSVAEAQAVVQRIKGEQQSLNGSLAFALDESLQPSSSLIVDLNRTTDPALAVGLDSGFAQLANRCESPVSVSRLLFYREQPTEVRVQPLPEEQRLSPGEDLSVLVPDASFDGVAAEYEIEEDTSVSLSELRVDVGMLEVGIGVDTDLQPQEQFAVAGSGQQVALETIQVLIDAPGSANDSVTLQRDGTAFSTGVVSLLVPLDRYLDPEARVLRYRATYTFTDGTELATDWLVHNYGENPNLTVRRQRLQHLLGSSGG